MTDRADASEPAKPVWLVGDDLDETDVQLTSGRVDLDSGWSLVLPTPCMAGWDGEADSFIAWGDDRSLNVEINVRPVLGYTAVSGHQMLSDARPSKVVDTGRASAVAGRGWFGSWDAGSLRLGGTVGQTYPEVHWFTVIAAATNTVMVCSMLSASSADQAWAREVCDGIAFDGLVFDSFVEFESEQLVTVTRFGELERGDAFEHPIAAGTQARVRYTFEAEGRTWVSIEVPGFEHIDADFPQEPGVCHLADREP